MSRSWLFEEVAHLAVRLSYEPLDSRLAGFAVTDRFASADVRDFAVGAPVVFQEVEPPGGELAGVLFLVLP